MDVRFYLNSKEVLPPAEWQNTKVKMVFNENTQPSLTIDEFTFFNEHTEIIEDWIATAGIFEGLPFSIKFTEQGYPDYEFKALLDLTSLKPLSQVEYKSKVKMVKSLDLMDDKFRSISYGYLVQEKGWFSNDDYIDVPVIIKKKFDTLEVVIAGLAIFIITKELVEHTEKLADEISKTIAQIAAGVSTALPAFIIQLISTALYHIAYYALMLIAIIKLLKTLQENLAPRQVYYKGIGMKRALQRALEYFELGLDCDIEMLDNLVYLPSKTSGRVRANKNDEGIPNAADYGYNVAEMFALALRIMNANWTVIDNKFVIRNEGSPFWSAQSKNIMPSSIETETFRYNANEMIANRIISLMYDPSDDWTMPGIKNEGDYSKGTNYQVITDFTAKGDQLSKMNKGLEEINIPMALGKRREKLSAGDIAVKTAFFITDQLIALFGGRTVADKINEHKGALMISDPNFDVAKILYMKDGLIPKNHRDYVSAKSFYNNFYSARSFVTRPELTQRKIYENIKIPFDFPKFIEYLQSPFFTTEADTSTHGGKKGKLLEIEWFMGQSEAMASFYINEIYVKNQLTEYGIES